MKNITKMEKTFSFNCSCGCSNIRISIDNDLDNMVLIEHYVSSFYSRQNSISQNIKDRLRMIWCGITGKDYSLYDIVLDEEDLIRFKEFCKSLEL